MNNNVKTRIRLKPWVNIAGKIITILIIIGELALLIVHTKKKTITIAAPRCECTPVIIMENLNG